MKLILAQGNPGTQYDGTRHNVGFYMLDVFAQDHGVSFKEKAKFHAVIAETTINGEKVILAKPTTYYNDTGRTLRALVDFYKVAPSDIVVVHDELALPFKSVRVRSSGSDAGNNGIKSLNGAIGQEYRRIRVGAHSELRDKMEDANFVTGKFTKAEADTLVEIAAHVSSLLSAFVHGTLVDETVRL